MLLGSNCCLPEYALRSALMIFCLSFDFPIEFATWLILLLVALRHIRGRGDCHRMHAVLEVLPTSIDLSPASIGSCGSKYSTPEQLGVYP